DSLAYHVSKTTFGELVERALEELPEQFARHLEEVSIEIRDRPSIRQLKQVGLGKKRHLLLGLYDGVPMTHRSVEHSGLRPPVIYLFQEDIELASSSEQDLIEQVRKTVLHEIGHHFGMD